MYHHEPVCRVLNPSVLEYLIRTLSVDVVVVVVIFIVVVVEQLKNSTLLLPFSCNFSHSIINAAIITRIHIHAPLPMRVTTGFFLSRTGAFFKMYDDHN